MNNGDFFMKPIYLGFDIPEYNERLRKAISRYGLPRGAPRAWLRDPDFEAWGSLGYMQPSGAMYWQCYLKAALQAAVIADRPDLSTITILDERWHFGERHWDFFPKKIEYQVRRALLGLNYLVVIEFEIFPNVRYQAPPPPGSVAAHEDQGCVTAPHIQGFIWGQVPSRRRRAKFAGGIFRAPGVKIIEVYDFSGALRYLGKPPHRGRRIFRLKEGKSFRRSWSKLSLKRHHLLLSNLHQYHYPDLTFAGGEGRAILAHAKLLWRDYVPGAIHPTDHRWPLESGLVKRRQLAIPID
jgi:hypothetical protein